MSVSKSSLNNYTIPRGKKSSCQNLAAFFFFLGLPKIMVHHTSCALLSEIQSVAKAGLNSCSARSTHPLALLHPLQHHATSLGTLVVK